jgi:hypothetical protein
MDTFEAAAAQRTRGQDRRATVMPRRRHTYCLSSRMFCDICGRRMQGSWNHGAPYYRCIFPAEYAGATGQHPAAVYLRESSIVPPLDEWLAEAFEPDRLTETIIAMEDAQQGVSSSDAQRSSIRARLSECDRQLGRFKELLLAGTDPNLVAGWINQSQVERLLLERDRGAIPETIRLSQAQIAYVARELAGVVTGLHEAEPEQKLYAALGLRLTYKPAAGIVLLESRPIACTQVGVGGASSTSTPRGLLHRYPVAA